MKVECYNENSLENFILVRDFLRELATDKLYENWHWARWGWMMGHPNLEDEMLNMIGLWKDDKEVVGIATHDMRIGESYLIFKSAYSDILKDMVEFTEKNITNDDDLFIVVNDKNNVQIDLLKSLGYSKTDKQEIILEYDLKDKNLYYSLTDGFMVASFKEDKENNKYMRVLWKGFEEQGEPPIIDEGDDEPLRRNWKEELSIFVKALDGEYVAHCGMWYDEGEKTAYIEPVCTVPEYRKNGFAKIAVYEDMSICRNLGAERAVVVSNQAFYYKLGFEVSSIYSFWRKKIAKQ